MRVRSAVFVLASLAAHVGVLAGTGGAADPEAVPLALAGWNGWTTEGAPRRAYVAAARSDLVRRGREARARGTLLLGELLLEANRLDALEQGRTLDIDDARARYLDRVARLKAHEALSERLPDAIAEVFRDLSYVGSPGGLMADVLSDRTGSCEPLTHLVVATMWDAGLHDRAALRVYGGVGPSGVAHVAPIARGREDASAGETTGDIDLMSGTAPHPGGITLPADELVEVYARAHGLAASSRAHGGAVADRERRFVPAGGPTLAAGYPDNQDVHPGGLPLYASRALRGVMSPDGTALEDAHSERLDALPAGAGADCAYRIPMAVLSPPRVTWIGTDGAGDGALEPRRIPRESELTRRSELVQSVESELAEPHRSQVERLMSYACLAALYGQASMDFALRGDHRLAALASERALHAESEGHALLSRLWTAEPAPARQRLAEAVAARFSGRSWMLLTLPDSEALVLAIASGGLRERGAGWDAIFTLAALVVYEPTRGEALARVARLTKKDQMDVMHEVFDAHDHLRPWASAFALDDLPHVADTEFVRAYRVFRHLAWRLWDGHRPIGETLHALAEEIAEARLSPSWESHFVTYYGNHVLGLYQHRDGGMDIVRSLAAYLAERRDLEAPALRRRLAFVEARRRLDAKTLADAHRAAPD